MPLDLNAKFALLGQDGMPNIRAKDSAGFVYAVDMFGQIRELPLRSTLSHPQLDIEWDKRGNRIVGIKSVSISAEGRRQGYSLLFDLYDRDGWPEGYDIYCDFVTRCKAAKRMRQTPPEFPETHLPREVVKRRNSVGAIADIALPPPKFRDEEEAVHPMAPAARGRGKSA